MKFPKLLSLLFPFLSVISHIVPPGEGGGAANDADNGLTGDPEFAADLMSALGRGRGEPAVKSEEKKEEHDESEGSSDDEAEKAGGQGEEGDVAGDAAETAAVDDKSGGDESAKDKEIAELKARLEAAEKRVGGEAKDEPVKPSVVPDSIFKDREALEKREADVVAMLKLMSRHLDGYTGKDAAGKDVELSAEQVRERFAELQEELLVNLPRERKALERREVAVESARKAYPEHFDPKNPMSHRVREVFSEVPGLANHPEGHRIAAEIIAGRKAREVPKGEVAKPAEKPAVKADKKAEPPVVPTGRGGAFAPTSAKVTAKGGMSTEEFRRRGATPDALRDLLRSQLV